MTTVTAEKLGDILATAQRAEAAFHDDKLKNWQSMMVVGLNLRIIVQQLEALRDDLAIPKMPALAEKG